MAATPATAPVWTALWGHLDTPEIGSLAALGSACTWAVISLLARTLSPTFNSIAINAIRCSLGGVLLLIWLVVTGGIGKLTELSASSFWLMVVSIVVAIGIGDTVFFESSRRLGLTRALTISMIYPLIATVLAVTFLREPITLRVAAGSVLTVAGLALILGRRREDSPRGESLGVGLSAACLASLAWAISATLMRVPLREVDATTAQAIRLPLAGALLWATPWTRGAWKQLKGGERAAFLEMFGLGVLTAVSSILFVAGLKYAGVAIATVLSSTAPIFGVLLEILWLREGVATATILGVLVTVAGIVVLQL